MVTSSLLLSIDPRLDTDERVKRAPFITDTLPFSDLLAAIRKGLYARQTTPCINDGMTGGHRRELANCEIREIQVSPWDFCERGKGEEGSERQTRQQGRLEEDALLDMETVCLKGAFDSRTNRPSIRRGDEGETQFLGI